MEFLWQHWLIESIGITLLLLWLVRDFTGRLVLRSTKWKRIVQFTAGFGLWSGLSWVFDNIAYPAVLAWRGVIEGGMIMTSIAIFVELIFLLVYEYQKVDWMGMDALESVRENGDKWLIRFRERRFGNPIAHYLTRIVTFVPMTAFRIVLWMVTKGDVFAFFALSIFAAPFPTTIYLRHGRFDGLKKRDWAIFFASAIVSNVYWIARSYGVVIIVRFFFRVFE